MISLSILQTHEPKNLRKFISEANKRIRATISAEIKEERKKFSIKMMEKRKIEKEKRIIKIPLRAKKDDLIKVIMDNKKHFKEIKKNVTKQDKIKDLENEINEMKNKIKELNLKKLNELSKKYMDFKKLAGLENKKFKGIVKEIYKREQELKKPKIPTIKITEEEYKTDGGGKADPKAVQFKIPKPTSKLRIVPKKPKAQLGQSGLGQKRKREEGKPKKKKIIDVEVPENKEKPKPKPKIPSITITEAEKPKRKVLKVGGRFITPKPKAEVKSSLPPIPKTKNKIRLPKKEPASAGGKAKKHELDNIDQKETNIFKSNKGKNNLKYFTDNYELSPSQLRKIKKIFELPVYNMAIPKDNQVDKDNRIIIYIRSDSGSGSFKLFKKNKKEKAGPADEELEDLSKFVKSKPVFKEDTVEDLMKFIKYHKKQGNDAIVKSLEKKLKELKGKGKAKAKPEPEPESEEEPDEIPYKDFKLIEGVPKNMKKIWYDYVDDRTGYANKVNQDDELEELQRIEKNYIEAEAIRKNKSVSAKKQFKAVRTIGSILVDVRNDINNNPDLKKIYKLFIPTILKKVLGEIEKDKQDLIKEQKAILKQEKEDEKAYKKLLKEEEKENKSK